MSVIGTILRSVDQAKGGKLFLYSIAALLLLIIVLGLASWSVSAFSGWLLSGAHP
ncbi:MAG: hypothetical protein M0037_03900 [Betaproteobacteria bacterium]|nr:hypothetical protein [Betaproteobacteria bacterium]